MINSMQANAASATFADLLPGSPHFIGAVGAHDYAVRTAMSNPHLKWSPKKHSASKVAISLVEEVRGDKKVTVNGLSDQKRPVFCELKRVQKPDIGRIRARRSVKGPLVSSVSITLSFGAGERSSLTTSSLMDTQSPAKGPERVTQSYRLLRLPRWKREVWPAFALAPLLKSTLNQSGLHEKRRPNLKRKLPRALLPLQTREKTAMSVVLYPRPDAVASPCSTDGPGGPRICDKPRASMPPYVSRSELDAVDPSSDSSGNKRQLTVGDERACSRRCRSDRTTGLALRP